MSHRRAIFLTLIVSLIGTVTLLAQGQTGAITGNVTDPSGGVLKGAQISLESKNVNVVSNEQGLFLINGLTPGNYTLKIIYVGFAPFNKTVDVAAGQTAKVDAQLQVQSASESVVVTAPRAGGEVEAINIERTADNIVQVLPAEVIRSLPNANMADALGRLPSVTLERDEGEGKYVQVRGTEPRLTNTTIDGITIPSPEPGVRQIKFDAIPADSVESVEINKTLEANMDGDGIGGSVNLVTKTATNIPTISLGAMGGYTPIINGRGLTEETGTIGQRFGLDKKLGILVGGSYDWNGRGIDDIEPVPDIATLPGGTTMPWKDAMDIREYQYFRSRWGLNGSADYRVGTGGDVYLRWFYSDFKNYGDRWVYSLTDNTPNVQLLNPQNVGNGTTPPSFNNQLRNPDIGIGNVVLGGSHVRTGTWFSWDLSASRAFYGNSPYSTSSFSNSLATSMCNYDPTATTNQFLPQWTAACYTERSDPRQFSLSDFNRGLGISAQVNLQAAGSVGKHYNIGSHAATIEVGGKFRNVHKFSDGYTVDYSPTTTILMSSFPSRLTNNRYYLGGDYKLASNPSEEEVAAFAQANPNDFTFSSTQGHDPKEFDIIEHVSAGYVMNTIDFANHMRFVAGVRFEGTSDRVSNFSVGSFPCPSDPTTTCSSLNSNKFSGSYITVLPSASLKWGVGSNSYLRFVYSRGLSRPDPADIAQALDWTDNGNGANRYSVSFGNANLKAEIGDDFDVLFDHYLQPFGAVSLGYFYKHLSNPIITSTYQLVNYQPPGGPLGNYLATQPVNAGSAWISGFEAAYLQHFTALPGAWAGLGLSANFGYTASSTSGIPGRSDHPRLLRMSPNAFNISPTYDKGRFSMRVGMSYNEASIYGYQYTDGTPGGLHGPDSDIYFYSHLQWDAQASVGLSHGLTFVVYGLNLNNEVFGFYQGAPQYMIQREYYQPTIAAGFRWSPVREK